MKKTTKKRENQIYHDTFRSARRRWTPWGGRRPRPWRRRSRSGTGRRRRRPPSSAWRRTTNIYIYIYIYIHTYIYIYIYISIDISIDRYIYLSIYLSIEHAAKEAVTSERLQADARIRREAPTRYLFVLTEQLHCFYLKLECYLLLLFTNCQRTLLVKGFQTGSGQTGVL